ncbi:PAS domain-containing protein [Emergencia timonensis]
MSNLKKLEKYFPLVDFWGEVCGPAYEILLHDVSEPNHSVVKIVNNHISHREIGSPLTDLAINLIESKEYETKSYVANYLGKTKEGRHLVASTFFIKENNKLIGLLCVNHDTHEIQDIFDDLEKFIENHALYPKSNKAKYQENFDTNINGHMYDIVEREINDSIISPDRMKASERKVIVNKLNDYGVFAVRGMIPFVAEKLCTSEPTIYRYLKEIKNK